MYKKVDTNLGAFPEREREVLEFWKKNEIFRKSLASNEGGREFNFYDGPPTANGKPHIGHILTRVMKDIIPRYKTMKGFRVSRKAGWDTHGLPVELEVEKELKIDGKREIEKYGVEKFIGKCKESVWKYKAEWERMSERVGFWADMENPYVTYDDNYIESVWWSLKQISDKGLLYKGHKVVPYCPRCGTALSSHEVAQGYKSVTETSVFVKFKKADEANVYFLAWTTTPWTLPSNAALCLNPRENYARVAADDGAEYILAEKRVPSLFEGSEHKIVSVKRGREYERVKYEPLYPFAVKEHAGKAWYVTCGDFVTLTDGSGVVHIAPAFGEDDAEVGRRYKLPFIKLVDEGGRLTSDTGDFSGKAVKAADKDIISDLKRRGLSFKELRFEHNYPFCWRCDTPLIYYARSSWFINTRKIRALLVRNNSKINWIPESIGRGRMGNFLENVVDWGISRERYWGTPLPVWTCEKCGASETIGGRAELKARSGLKGDIELHKPYVDGVELKCACGGAMKRESAVVDCWYDSGAMPFAQHHYPFNNAGTFERNFPADFISEAVDQTRGWFYTLHVLAALLFGRPAFKNCLVLGHVNDKDGQKMSKHKGNVVDPWSVLDRYGADAARWYFYTVSNPYLPRAFHGDAVGEAQRKFIGTLWNTYSFYVLYADIDGFNPHAPANRKKITPSVMDRWILSELQTLIKNADGNLAVYKITESARAIQDFTDKLSNWYVRRCRERFWGGGMGGDKKAAFSTLFTVLERLTRLVAPFVPFTAEMLYQNIVRAVNPSAPESVHLCKYPKPDLKLIDAELERGMDAVQSLAFLGRAARAAAGVKNRQPLSLMLISGDYCDKLTPELTAVLADELNVKKIETADDLSDFSSYALKPQLKTLGPKYGALLSAVRSELERAPAEIYAAVRGGGTYTFASGGEKIALNEEDLLITAHNKEGYAAESDARRKVVLDIRLTDELITEGYAREIVSKIQTMRKEAGFEVTDRVTVNYEAGDVLARVFNSCPDIGADTLASKITRGGINGGGFVKKWDINGEPLEISVTRV